MSGNFTEAWCRILSAKCEGQLLCVFCVEMWSYSYDNFGVDSQGDTALGLAARAGELKCVEALIRAGANTSAKNKNVCYL
jgi:hypothetical protein